EQLFSLLHFFFSSRRRHTSWPRDWSSDVCSSDLTTLASLRTRCSVFSPVAVNATSVSDRGTRCEVARGCSSLIRGKPFKTCFAASTPMGSASRAPNKRVKLAGVDRAKGSGVLCAYAHELSFDYTACGGRVARSLSAIR